MSDKEKLKQLNGELFSALAAFENASLAIYRQIVLLDEAVYRMVTIDNGITIKRIGLEEQPLEVLQRLYGEMDVIQSIYIEELTKKHGKLRGIMDRFIEMKERADA